MSDGLVEVSVRVGTSEYAYMVPPVFTHTLHLEDMTVTLTIEAGEYWVPVITEASMALHPGRRAEGMQRAKWADLIRQCVQAVGVRPDPHRYAAKREAARVPLA